MNETMMKVLVNEEEQYSLWPGYLPIPGGWKDTGVNGSREDCLAYVQETWTDMRPRSLREQMDKTHAAADKNSEIWDEHRI